MRQIIVCTIMFFAVTKSAAGDIVRYTNFAQWQSAVAGNYSTIDFKGWPNFTIITDQYAPLGLTFSDGDDFARLSPHFVDGAGMESSAIGNGIGIDYSTMQFYLGFHFIGDVRVQLYFQDKLIYTSNIFFAGASLFGGLVSDLPFDRAILYDPGDPVVAIDNLYFGPPIPTPGALMLFAIAAIVHRRRRRAV